jgi:hypothetical protein
MKRGVHLCVCVCGLYTQQTQDSVQWLSAVNMVIDLQVS